MGPSIDWALRILGLAKEHNPVFAPRSTYLPLSNSRQAFPREGAPPRQQRHDTQTQNLFLTSGTFGKRSALPAQDHTKGDGIRGGPVTRSDRGGERA